MHPRRSWILLCALVTAAQAAVIYKWTDADGVVHYSDQPVEGAEKIVTSGGPSTYSGAGSIKGLNTAQSADKKPKTALAFDLLSISSPTPEQTFYGDETVPVALTVNPALKGTQVVNWFLNGAPLQQSALTFSLAALARGTYSIGATITDQSTGESMSAPAVTFYVRQPSELSPQHHR